MIDELYQKFLEECNNIKYSEYIRSQHWKDFRQEALEFFNNKCSICDNPISEAILHVHHKNNV